MSKSLYLITRPRDDAERFLTLLHNLGKDAVIAPLIETVPQGTERPSVSSQAALIFTSRNGVRYFSEKEKNLSFSHVLALGEGTADEVTKTFGSSPTTLGTKNSEEFAARLIEYCRDNFLTEILFPVSQKSRGIIPKALAEVNIKVHEWFLYDTRPVTDQRQRDEFVAFFVEGTSQAIPLFFSPSAVRAAAELLRECSRLHDIRAVSFGSVTSRAIREEGFSLWWEYSGTSEEECAAELPFL